MFGNYFNNNIVKKMSVNGVASSTNNAAIEKFFGLTEDKTGRKVFEEEHREAITTEANDRRTGGDARPVHALYQQVLRERWASTTDEMKREYQQRAEFVGDRET